MPKIDLLPCPFCGKLETLKMMDIQNTVYHVICDAVIGGCGASTGWNYTTPEEAAKEWNTRASGWISCSERMPEPGVSVLVTDGINQMVTWHEVIDGEAMWVDNFIAYVNVRFGEVTHWRPTPELPKGN